MAVEPKYRKIIDENIEFVCGHLCEKLHTQQILVKERSSRKQQQQYLYLIFFYLSTRRSLIKFYSSAEIV